MINVNFSRGVKIMATTSDNPGEDGSTFGRTERATQGSNWLCPIAG
jgi:hypothetical protein